MEEAEWRIECVRNGMEDEEEARSNHRVDYLYISIKSAVIRNMITHWNAKDRSIHKQRVGKPASIFQRVSSAESTLHNHGCPANAQ